MDISLRPLTTPATVPAATTRPADAASSARESAPALTISETRVSDLDATEAIPDSVLVRDDDLGKLFSAAFTLPAPPMPEFSATGDPPILPGMAEVRV